MQLGGPTWREPLGPKDSGTASQSAANSNLPSHESSLSALITLFSNKNLSPRDMTELSGAHTIDHRSHTVPVLLQPHLWQAQHQRQAMQRHQ